MRFGANIQLRRRHREDIDKKHTSLKIVPTIVIRRVVYFPNSFIKIRFISKPCVLYVIGNIMCNVLIETLTKETTFIVSLFMRYINSVKDVLFLQWRYYYQLRDVMFSSMNFIIKINGLVNIFIASLNWSIFGWIKFKKKNLLFLTYIVIKFVRKTKFQLQ